MISIRVDNDLKKAFDDLCKEFGLSSSAAMTLFMKAVVRERRIPFEIRAEVPAMPQPQPPTMSPQILQQMPMDPQGYPPQSPMGAPMPMQPMMPSQMPMGGPVPMNPAMQMGTPMGSPMPSMDPQQMQLHEMQGNYMPMSYSDPNVPYGQEAMGYGQDQTGFTPETPNYQDMVQGYASGTYEPSLFDGMEPRPATPGRKMTIDDISYEAVHAQLNGKKKDK